MGSWRTRDLVAVAAILAAVATAAVAVDPTVRFAFESSEIRLGLQVASALIAALLAYLFYGRFKRRRLVGELMLVYALSILATTNLFFAFYDEPELRTGSLSYQAWVPVTLRLVAALAIATAALAPDRTIRAVHRPGVTIVIATAGTLAVVAVGAAVLHGTLPEGIRLQGETAGAPDFVGHPALLAGILATAALFAGSSYGFTLRAERRPDPLASSLAVACALAAFASLCSVLYPSIETVIVQSGDWLLLLVYLVLLVGAEREIDRYWGQLAGVAVYEERRRLARELHDGLAQELAFVVTQTRLLVRGGAPAGTDQHVAAAAERALDESRRAITALSGDPEEPLHLALARAAEDVAGRLAVKVHVRASPAVRVPPTVREALVRIMREAITNAARHGHAQHVDVTLTAAGVLRITDDGTGFDLDGAGAGRFGLISMRERAERLNARFGIDSKPGRGTSVEVALR